MIASFLPIALKSLLVAAITLGLLRLNARRSAAERSTIAHLGLFALVALPLASLALPPLPIMLPAAPPAPLEVAPVAEMAMAGTPMSDVAPATDWIALLAPYAYLFPALALLLLTGIALARLSGLRSRARVLLDPDWLGAMARTQQRMGSKDGTALLISDELLSPISWGVMRPTIVLNAEAIDATEQAEAIIAHELAHVIHRDWAKLMLARVATAAFWFNPLAWVLAREAHQLREEAADDAVLASDIAGPDYAQLLVGIARQESRNFLLTAHGVAPGRNSLRRRIARVLDAAPARRVSTPSWVAGFTTGMLVMATPLAAVTFGRDTPRAPVASKPSPKNVSVRDHAPIARPKPPQPGAAEPAAATPAPRKRARSAAAVENTDESAPAALTQRASEISDRVIAQFPDWPWPSPSQPRAGAAAPAPAAQPMAPVGQQDAADGETLRMRAAGITREFQREMAAVGFPELTLRQLAQARSVGLNCSYVEEMRKAGLGGDFNTFLQARAAGLTPGYVRGMVLAGVQATPVEYQQLRAMDVTSGYVSMLRSSGVPVSNPEGLLKLKAVGFVPVPRRANDP